MTSDAAGGILRCYQRRGVQRRGKSRLLLPKQTAHVSMFSVPCWVMSFAIVIFLTGALFRERLVSADDAQGELR
jgi:hypothetical protein